MAARSSALPGASTRGTTRVAVLPHLGRSHIRIAGQASSFRQFAVKLGAHKPIALDLPRGTSTWILMQACSVLSEQAIIGLEMRFW